jgi:Flp pilus assembly protein TadD
MTLDLKGEYSEARKELAEAIRLAPAKSKLHDSRGFFLVSWAVLL